MSPLNYHLFHLARFARLSELSRLSRLLEYCLPSITPCQVGDLTVFLVRQASQIPGTEISLSCKQNNTVMLHSLTPLALHRQLRALELRLRKHPDANLAADALEALQGFNSSRLPSPVGARLRRIRAWCDRHRFPEVFI